MVTALPFRELCFRRYAKICAGIMEKYVKRKAGMFFLMKIYRLVQDMEEKGTHKESVIKEAFLKWLGLFLVIVASLAIYFVVQNIKLILSTIGDYVGILRPVIYGCVIAYILNPLMKIYQDFFLKLYERKKRKASEKVQGIITGIAIACSLLTGILIIIILCWMVFPQLVISLTALVQNLPDQANYYYYKLNESIKNNTFFADRLQDVALNITEYLDGKINAELLPWLQKELLPNVNIVAMEFANGVMSVMNLLYNLFIGIIVAIYILAGKKTFAAQAKKMVYGLLRKKSADVVIQYVRISNAMFSGFISGKIVDSTILGVICFFCMKLFSMPYAMLISVIVGVTNIIPVFGPYIGLIPSTFLILLVNPIQAVYFIILIAILQQLDGNIIGPAILGESTGLSAFWVLFAILLFGGIWGIVGMIIGVPLFAVIYRIVADFINWKLQKKALSTSTNHYRNLKEIEVDEYNQISYIPYTEQEQNAGKANIFTGAIRRKRKWKRKKKSNSGFSYEENLTLCRG